MNDEQRDKLRKIADTMPPGPLGPWRVAHLIAADPQAHVDALVAAGVIHEHWVSKGAGKPKKLIYTMYPPVTPKPEPKVVKAGYRKLPNGHHWTWTCSEHTEPNGFGWARLAEVPFASHFADCHANDTVEWDDPPQKVEITYERDGSDRATYTCSSCRHTSHPATPENTELMARAHAGMGRHANDDVTFGELPEPQTTSMTRSAHLRLKGFAWFCAGVSALAISAGVVDWLVGR